MEVIAAKVNEQTNIDVPLKPIEATYIQPKTKAEPPEEITAQEPSEVTSKDVMEFLDSFQEMSKTIKTKLNFTVHEENNEIIIRVIDKESNQLIRQFPSDEMLSIHDKMRDLTGFLFNSNA